MKRQILKIKEIILDDKLFPRKEVNERIVKDYAKAMNKGDIFPAIFIGLFRGKHYLIDGRHRLEAFKERGEQYIQTEIKTNYTDFRDMFLDSIRFNKTHGLRLKHSDKLKIAHTMKDMEFQEDSITKVTGLEIKDLGVVKGRIISSIIKEKVRVGDLPKKIRETMPDKQESDIVDKKEVKAMEEKYKVTYQSEQLKEIYDYLSKTKFEVKSKRIKNWLKKIYAKLKTIDLISS